MEINFVLSAIASPPYHVRCVNEKYGAYQVSGSNDIVAVTSTRGGAFQSKELAEQLCQMANEGTLTSYGSIRTQLAAGTGAPYK